MRKILGVIFVALILPAIFAFRVAVPTTGDYGQNPNPSIYIIATPTGTAQTQALIYLAQSCACGTAPMTWYAQGVYGIQPNNKDQSMETVYVQGIATITFAGHSPFGNNHLTNGQTPTAPNLKVQKKPWGKYLVF